MYSAFVPIILLWVGPRLHKSLTESPVRAKREAEEAWLQQASFPHSQTSKLQLSSSPPQAEDIAFLHSRNVGGFTLLLLFLPRSSLASATCLLANSLRESAPRDTFSSSCACKVEKELVQDGYPCIEVPLMKYAVHDSQSETYSRVKGVWILLSEQPVASQ
mmetsp:Transcript_105327/g.187224  ORF Transcript_105327/g.187224 Transcript_105327/m.187224 type:complete len:161 (-) Transcript_105327:220-702(-)